MARSWFSRVWVMNVLENVRVTSALKLYVMAASLAVAGVGVAVLIGWFLNIPVLKSFLPGLATMKANTALCFVLAGSSLWLLRREEASAASPKKQRLGKILASLVLAIGLLTLSQYVFHWNLGIDQFLVKDLVTPA